MKQQTRHSMIILILAVIAMLALSGCSSGYSPVKGSLVMGQTYQLPSGDTLNDDLTVMGGTAKIERDSTVNGDISVLGGTLDVDGTVNGDISIMGGAVHLNDNAVVHGSISQIGGSVTRATNSKVDGSMNRSQPIVPAPSAPRAPSAPSAPRVNFNLDPIFQPILAVFRALALAALAILVGLFASRPMDRVASAVQAQPLISGGIGLLTILVVPALLVILAITIILFPVSLLGLLLIAVGAIFGFLSMGLLTGRHIAGWLHQNWTDPLAAGVGTLVLSLVVSLFNLILCLGGLATFLIGIMGLGAVIVTRFGTRDYRTGGGFPGNPFPASPRPAPAAQRPSEPYDMRGEPTTQYYAPHVVTPSADLTAEPVPPVTVAPDLDFLNQDYTEKKPGEGSADAEQNKPDEPVL